MQVGPLLRTFFGEKLFAKSGQPIDDSSIYGPNFVNISHRFFFCQALKIIVSDFTFQGLSEEFSASLITNLETKNLVTERLKVYTSIFTKVLTLPFGLEIT